MTRSIAGLAIVLSFGVAAAQVPQSPDNCRAIPDYGDNSIIVEWDDVANELGYRVYRAGSMAGPFQQVGGDQPPDASTLTDLVPDPTAEYFYLVRAFNLDGESADSNIFQQNVKVVWPYPGHFALLHNWNDTIGRAGIGGQGYHNGLDLQQLVGGPQGQIVFPRGGIVSRVGNLGADNNHIFVEVKIGSDVRHDSFNHLDGPNVNTLGFDVGDYVRAGESLAPIGDDYFTGGTLDWVDHVHFYAPNDPFTGVMDGQNPLKIFLQDHERDPQEVRPAI
ncbi:MAG: hypothetical protein R3344_03610, partial [Acidobacteriota bacterium]|nr:hypothetical protein [Acidobacteriota bacterium]